VRLLFAVFASLAALLAWEARTADAQYVKPPAGCPVVGPPPGASTGDFEAVFGRRKARSNAVALVKLVRRRGFRCAVIEKEQRACRIRSVLTRCGYEVAVIGLNSEASAEKIVLRARRKGLPAYIAQS
jgi:hypothetical protein